MFREPRLAARRLSTEETLGILEQGDYGTLAVMGDGGYPYSVPLNYVCKDGKLYFHAHTDGHKVDAIRADGKVCFSVVAKAAVNPPKFSTDYASAIVFGTARFLDGEEKRQAISLLLAKYAPDHYAKGMQIVDAMWNKFTAFAVDIEHMTGKGLESGS